MPLKKNVLVVEGRDDCMVISNVCECNNMPEVFSIIDESGADSLLVNLPVRLKGSGLERLGIVLDADPDTGVASRWGCLTAILAKSGYTSVPSQPEPMGTIVVQNDKPVVGVWLMPDNRLDGMLEDFVAMLVPRDDSMWDWADECLDQVPDCSNKFRQNRRSKARIHTWLAWQLEPGKPMGLAITMKVLDGTAASTKDFLSWLRRLYQVPVE